MVYHHFCCTHLQIWTVNLILDRCTYQSSHTIGSICDILQAIFTLWSVMHCFKKHMYTLPRAERQRWTANSSMAVTKKGVWRLRWLGFCCDVHLKNPQFGWFEPWHVIFDGSKPMKLPYLRDFSPPLTSCSGIHHHGPHGPHGPLNPAMLSPCRTRARDRLALSLNK